MPVPPSPAAALIDGLQQMLQTATGRPVRRVETHISWVLLDGKFAWKVKKPVRLGFLDFSALEARRHGCEEELRLNRRLAPAIYLDVVPIYGSATAPRLGGDGKPIEYALRMRQFPAGALLSERLTAGSLATTAIDRLAARLAAFHAAAPAATGETPYGAPAAILAATSKVLAGLQAQVGARTVADLHDWCAAQGRRLRARFVARKRRGWVREGHGDLHLDNLVTLGDEVTAFDCVEFDPGLRWIDVQSDIAFLTMDLTAHGRSDLAWRFLDRWLDATGDHAGVAVLRYYAVYRALARALVTGLRRAEGLASAGPDYVGTARRLAAAGDARLLITHGLSGSGKSHVAQRLLEVAGAIRLRSDVERKRLFGLHPLDASAPVAHDIYAPAATRRTYARLRESAAAVLDAGYPVIVDAAFLRARERDAFCRLADRKGVPFTILHCHADPAVLRQRVQARSTRRDDASEADLAVLERQLHDHDALSPDEDLVCITVDTNAPLDVDAIARRWKAAR